MYRQRRNHYHYEYHPSEMPWGVGPYSVHETPNDPVTDARVLFDAVRHGKTHLVRFILEAAQGDIVNCRDLHGKTPLMACCYTKEERARDKTTRLLLRHGADVNFTDDFGRTALSYVCEKRCNDILRILVKEHNIDPDIPDVDGNTPLSFSAMVGNDIACDSLIRHFRRLGLNVDVVNSEGFTPLLLAVKAGNLTCAQILRGQGKASLAHRDRKYGLNAAEWLEKRGYTMQDIAPVRQDGRGRSRFVKIANVAAMCSGPRKVAAGDNYAYQHFARDGIHLERDHNNEDGYLSDATTATMVSIDDDRYIQRRYSDNAHMVRKSSRNMMFRSPMRLHDRPKMRSIETQTMPALIDDEFEEDDATVADTAFTALNENFILERSKPRNFEKRNVMMNRTTSNKRFSLPEVGVTDMENSRKMSLDATILPEKLIATIELGDGRRQSIQIHPDSFKQKVYWTPYNAEDEDAETVNTLVFDKVAKSDVESQCSTNDEPVFA